MKLSRSLPSRNHPPAPRNRPGQALVEFAIIAFVLSFMTVGLLAIVVLALGSFQNNIAAENAGRILDGHHVLIEENFRDHFSDPSDPDYFDPNEDFENVTARQVYRFLNEYEISADGSVLYDESRLILSLEDWNNREDLNLPAINQSLLGQYIFDPDLVVDGQQGAYRFPGAVVTNQNTDPPTRTVLIPILPGPNGASGIGRTFHVTSTVPQFFYPVSEDWVAPVVIGKEQDGDGFEFRIIMFHPSQPASSMAIERKFDEQGRLISQTPVVADDNAVDAAIGGPPNGYVLAPPTTINPQYGASASRGQFGLGESLAFATKIRPYRLVFETSSLFRTGTPLYAVKYEAAGAQINLDNSETDVDDQLLGFEQLVIDRFTPERQRYIVNLDATSDFDTNFVQLLPNDGGVWRVTVAAEFEPTNSLSWEVNHVLQLRLYKNRQEEHLIAAHNVTSGHSEPISITGQSLIEVEAGDALQVRVFTQRATGSYEVRLTGRREYNWVSFDRVRD